LVSFGFGFVSEDVVSEDVVSEDVVSEDVALQLLLDGVEPDFWVWTLMECSTVWNLTFGCGC
jgi:hypothetical protein